MSNPITTKSYLQRIGFNQPVAVDIDTLRALCLAHMTSVPFENLDIALGKKVVLEPNRLLDKVVLKRRGGFCYELNFTFAWLLKNLGFNVSFLGAQVLTRGKYGPPLDHMLLLVSFTQGERPIKWIADVGFGDSFVEPIALTGEVQSQMGSRYKLVKNAHLYELFRQKTNEAFEAQYRFDLTTFELADYEQMCHYQQTSPESGFSYKSVCSIATIKGRKTISNGRYIETEGTDRTEQDIVTAAQYKQLLIKAFGMALWDDAPLQTLCIGRYQS